MKSLGMDMTETQREQLICCSKIRELKGSRLVKDFEVLKTLHKGNFSEILLVKKVGGEKMVLKGFPYEDSWVLDHFEREQSLNYTLSPHPNILTSFNVRFACDGALLYPMEFAPFGDLGKHMRKTKGLRNGFKDQGQVKLIMKQIASALEFMHLSFQIVHGNLTPQNILIFHTDLSQIKLCDFGCSENEGNHVLRGDFENPAFLPPELNEVLEGEKHYVSMATDAWQLGILLIFCLQGTTPWVAADISDSTFAQYKDWLKRKSLRLPECFKTFSPRLIRLLKRLLEPKLNKRYEVKEVFKYLKDDWIVASKSNILRRQSVFAGKSEEKVDKAQRSRSISSSPALLQRRSSLLSSSSSSGSKEKPNRAKSVKSVTFDISPERIFTRSGSCRK